MAVISAANSEPLVCTEETMRYRPLGKTGLMISALSFGSMRLGEDQELNTELISKAVELGVNYFETTRFYCQGQCQHRVAPGLREKHKGVIASGKAGMNPDTTAHSFRQEIECQLEVLGLTHFKFFQVGWFSWAMIAHVLKRGGVLEAVRQAQDEGLIQHLGFTGHDTPENFIKCIETGLFDCITVPYSLVHRKYEPTIKRAGELGIGVVAMCPLAGGVLAADSQKLKDALALDLPTAAMALRFVLANPDVSTACSGMSTIEMLTQNVRTVKDFDPEKDADFDQMCAGVDRLREELGDKICTACRYCMPCPQGVKIPRYMELYRKWKCFGLESAVRDALEAMPEDQSAANCTECGECEDKCPNELKIRDILQELTAAFQPK